MKKIFTFVAAALTAISASATFYAFDGTDLTESQALIDDEYAEVRVGNLPEAAVSNVYAISDYEAFYTPVNCALADGEKATPTRTLTFNDHQFEYAAYLRTEKPVPGTTNPEGTPVVKNDDMGRGTINCITIVAEPKKDCKISFYYMRLSNKTFECFDGGSTLTAVKDSLVAKNDTINNCDGGQSICEYHLTTYNLQKDHMYTFYTAGGTTQVYGFETAEGEGQQEVTEQTYGYNGTAANTMEFTDGASLTLTGNAEKTFGAGGSIDGVTAAKNSNGVQMTYVAPEGKCVGSVTFKAVTNDDAINAILKEVNGETINDTVKSLKDYTNPQVYTYNFETPVDEFTFTYGAKQVCFIMTVTFVDCGGEEEKAYLEFAVAAESVLEGEGNDVETGLVTLKGTTIEDKGAGSALKLDSENKYVVVAFYETIAAGAKIEVAFYAGSNPTDETSNGVMLLDNKATHEGVATLATKFAVPADKKNLVVLEYTTTAPMDEFYIYRAATSSVYFRSVKVYGEADTTEGIVEAIRGEKAAKMLVNGRIVILRGNKNFDLTGRQF